MKQAVTQTKRFLPPGRITIKYNYKAIPVDIERFRNQLIAMRSVLDCDVFDLGVVLDSDEVLAKLNKEYCGKKVPTDCISIPMHVSPVRFEQEAIFYFLISGHQENLKAGTLPPTRKTGNDLGDIYLSLPYAQRHCEAENIPLLQHLTALAAHSLCHLLGYDHQTNADYKLMKAKEDFLLERLKEMQLA